MTKTFKSLALGAIGAVTLFTAASAQQITPPPGLLTRSSSPS